MADDLQQRVSFIEYKGLRILYTDFNGLSADDYIPVLDAAIALVKQEKEKSIYTLSRHSKIYINEAVRSKTEEFAVAAKPFSKGAAAAGLMGIQRFIAQRVRSDIYFTDDIEDAKEHLYKLESGAQ